MNEKLTTDTQTDWARLALRDDNEIDYSDAPTVPLGSQILRIRQPDGHIIPVKNCLVPNLRLGMPIFKLCLMCVFMPRQAELGSRRSQTGVWERDITNG